MRLALGLILASIAFGEYAPQTSFNTGYLSPLMEARYDFGLKPDGTSKYRMGCRTLENFIVFPQGTANKRPGTKLMSQIPINIEFPTTGLTYEMAYISESGAIWGIPLKIFEIGTLTLDAGAARDAGGGIVGLPCTGHPFQSGQVIRISNGVSPADYYNGLHTLTAGTSANELQFTKAYSAATFAGDEVVVQVITAPSGGGRMCQDENGNIYYGYTTSGGKAVTTILSDGTVNDALFTPTDGWANTVNGIKVSGDFLYVYMSNTNLYKFPIAGGDYLWKVDCFGLGYEIDVDSSGNVYVVRGATGTKTGKYASADGAVTVMSDAPLAAGYAVCVDDTMSYTAGHTGVVISGGNSQGFNPSTIYNLSIRDLDDTGGTQIALGGTTQIGSGPDVYSTYTVDTGCILTHNNAIYVRVNNEKIYKLDKDLNIVTSIDNPDNDINGMFLDISGRIVLVKVDYTGSFTDQFQFYNDDLEPTGEIDGFYGSMLSSWDAPIGGAWIQGNAIMWPGLEQGAYEGVDETTPYSDIDTSPIKLVRFEYSTNDSYVLAFMKNSIGFYRAGAQIEE